jgi:hypothetical protein
VSAFAPVRASESSIGVDRGADADAGKNGVSARDVSFALSFPHHPRFNDRKLRNPARWHIPSLNFAHRSKLSSRKDVSDARCRTPDPVTASLPSRAARELQPQPAARERVAPGEVDPREARRDVAERGEKRVGDDVRVEAARVGEEASFEASERVHGELVRAREHVEDALREVRGEALEVEGRTRRRGGIPRVVRRAFADGSRHRFRGETQE